MFESKGVRMTDPTTLAVALVAAHRGLISAHQHAERFHYAMGEAIEAADEIEGMQRDPDTMREYGEEYRVRYERMLGAAAAALQKMPAAWAAILTANIGDAK